MTAALLADRAALMVSGEEAPSFLQGVITNDVDGLAPGEARFAALLSPQGKILCDFFVLRSQDGRFLVDCPKSRATDLMRRLTLYKLRARVEISDVSDLYRIAVAWPHEDGVAGEWFDDPRHPKAGRRGFTPSQTRLAAEGEAAYEERRIALGLPKGDIDFRYGDAFPHEADMDKLHGVSFRKGCYVGQEVVSRMQHRGLARTRVMRVRFAGVPPRPGAEIRAGETRLGQMGSAAADQGLAMLRTDRTEEAVASGVPIMAEDVELHLLGPAE